MGKGNTRLFILQASLKLTVLLALWGMAIPHYAHASVPNSADAGETPMVLSKYSLDIYMNASNSIQVESGSGSYEIVNMTPEIVETEFISDGIANARRHNSDDEGERIDDLLFIKGIALGDAVVRVIDKNTKEMADIDIHVTNAPRLTLSSHSQALTVGGSVTVEIMEGSRWYQVTSNNSDVVSANHYSHSTGGFDLNGKPVNETHEMIRISARNIGNAIVSVKDLSSGEMARIAVTVNDTGVTIGGIEWYLITDHGEMFPMSTVSMLVAADDSPYFSVLDHLGNILAEDVLQIHFTELDPTGVDNIKAEEPRNMLKCFVNNRLTLMGALGIVDVYSTRGLKVTSVSTAGEETVIDVSSLPTGTYIVRCGKQSFKFNKK